MNNNISNLTIEGKELYSYIKSNKEIKKVTSITTVKKIVTKCAENYIKDFCSKGTAVDEIFTNNDIEEVTNIIYNKIKEDKKDMNNILTLTQIKKICEENNYHFFEKETMKFFNSKIHGTVSKYNIFITSEYMEDPNEKKYSIRIFNLNTISVITIREFQEFNTLAEAKESKKAIIKALDKMGNREKEVLKYLYDTEAEGNIITFIGKNPEGEKFSFDICDKGDHAGEIVG